MIITNLF